MVYRTRKKQNDLTVWYFITHVEMINGLILFFEIELFILLRSKFEIKFTV